MTRLPDLLDTLEVHRDLFASLNVRWSTVEIVVSRLSDLYADIDQPFVPQDADFPHRDVPHRYALAATARVGGHYLGRMLQNSGGGTPAEYLSDGHPPHLAFPSQFSASRKPALAEYWQALWRHANDDGAPLAIKIDPYTLMVLWALGTWPLELNAWRWIYLYRKDVIDQAISLTLAFQSGAWMSIVKGKELTIDDISMEDVQTNINKINIQRDLWESIFSHFGIEPLRIAYEDLNENGGGSLAAVHRHIGLASAEPRPASSGGLEKQAGPLNSQVKERFLQAYPMLSPTF